MHAWMKCKKKTDVKMVIRIVENVILKQKKFLSDIYWFRSELLIFVSYLIHFFCFFYFQTTIVGIKLKSETNNNLYQRRIGKFNFFLSDFISKTVNHRPKYSITNYIWLSIFTLKLCRHLSIKIRKKCWYKKKFSKFFESNYKHKIHTKILVWYIQKFVENEIINQAYMYVCLLCKCYIYR